MRLGLIKEDVVLDQNEAFILCDSKGNEQIRLISIIDNGGSAMAYKAIRNKNGSSSVCIVKEYYPAQKEDIYKRNKVGEPIFISKNKEKLFFLHNFFRIFINGIRRTASPYR